MIKTSIIIPVFNDEEYLHKSLTSIFNQIADDPTVEVIVIDNGSTDESLKTLRTFPRARVLIENTHLNSPYSCRNRGIEVAHGEVIVLLDATCVPSPDWLANGLSCLETCNADIVGGNVKFDFEGKLSAAKIYDSLTNIKMKESIETRKVAKTANLFIKKAVFSNIGLFPEGIRSGADVTWTQKATQGGFTIVFCEKSIVFKPARGFVELIKKQWRVGIHQPLIWQEQHKKVSISSLMKDAITPISPSRLKYLLNEKGTPQMSSYYLKLVGVGQIVKTVMALANIKGMLKYRRKNG